MSRKAPGPLRWLRYAYGGALPERYREWVLHDVTCRSWVVRHLVRSLVQLLPFMLLLLLVLGPGWVTYLGLGAGLFLGFVYSIAYVEETCEHRLMKQGYPLGTGRAVRAERDPARAARERARYDADHRHHSS